MNPLNGLLRFSDLVGDVMRAVDYSEEPGCTEQG